MCTTSAVYIYICCGSKAGVGINRYHAAGKVKSVIIGFTMKKRSQVPDIRSTGEIRDKVRNPKVMIMYI